MTALVLAVGVLAISSSAVLIRVAEAPALSVAFYRLVFSAVLMGLIAAATRSRGWRAVDWRRTGAAGVALALHFWAWMRSLDYTSVLTSTLLVTTTPVWIALFARWLPLETRLDRRGWAGLTVAVAGGAVLALGPGERGARGDAPLLGAFLALLGSWLVAVYLVLGRTVRQRVPLATYATVTNAVAAATLALIVAATGAPTTGFPTGTWLAFVALAVLPQLVGHSAMLWAVRATSASVVSLAVLFEPLGAALLAWLFLAEPPAAFELGGGAILLIGLGLVIRARPHVPRETRPR